LFLFSHRIFAMESSTDKVLFGPIGVGGTARTRAAFDAAILANPYVPYLLHPDSIPFDRPPHFALRSREEGAYVADTVADAFAATDGALDWLAAQASRSPSRPGRRRRDRSVPPSRGVRFDSRSSSFT
jgi:hypothetical protein